MLIYKFIKFRRTTLRLGICSLFFVSCFSFSKTDSQLVTQSVYEIGYTDLAPLCYMNEQGQAEGGMIDVMNHLLSQHNIKSKYNFYPINRLMKNVADGNGSQIQFVFNLPQFKNKLLFDNEPVFDLALNIYWVKNKSRQIYELEDIKGKSIIMTRTHDYFGIRQKIIDEKLANILYAGTVINALEMLHADRADYVLSYDIFAKNFQKQHNIELASIPLEKFEFLLAVHHLVPDAESLLSSLSKTLKQMKSSGKVDELLSAAQ